MKTISIRARLMIGVALAAALLVAISSLFSYHQTRNGLIANIDDLISRTGQATSTYVSSWIASRGQVVSGAAMALDVGTEIIPTVTQGQSSGDFLYMYVGTSQGQMLMHPEESLPADFDPRTRPWYQQAQSQRRLILTPPYQDASSGDLVMTFAQPTSNGVVGADVLLTDIVDQVLAVQLGQSGYAALIDSNNQILVHPQQQRQGQNLQQLVGNVRLSSDRAEVNIDGTDWFASAFPIAGTDWRLLLMVPRNDVFAQLNTLAVTSLLTSVVTIAVLTLVSGLMISILLKPLISLGHAMVDIAEGEADLTKRLDITREDEIGRLSKSFNRFVESIHRLVQETLDSSLHLAQLSESARDNAQRNNVSVQLQQSEISQVAAAINEMSSTAAEVANNASDAAEAAHKASEEGKNGMFNASENKKRMGNLTGQIDTATDVIRQLDEQALQINSILSTIQEIAEQTNLLALNAAIEAARAGEQGRGFAVVADEVRALSKRTHEATGEIQAMIETLQNQTQNAVSIMDKSKILTGETADSAQIVTKSLTAIAEAINDISSRAQSIAEASREQNSATDEISRIATAIQDASDQLSENVGQATAQSNELHEVSDEIKANLVRFKV
ncbi:MAG: methyl-accepting chemotaxis protein [Saccharospirillum sp.]|nr:methyl-accepting chemotaxis protein [Saccharospirillum sp.]